MSNIGLPSTAERCLAVGASTGHELTDEEWWFTGDESRGRDTVVLGPRAADRRPAEAGYDSAPDNPFAAFPRWSEYGIGLGAYWVFGGTSGAGPHVAGAAVLLSQLGPEGGAAAIIDMLLGGVVVDELTGETPNTAYGYGRVSVAGALEAGPRGEPPALTLEAPARAAVGEEITLRPVVDDPDGDPDAALIRWDVGYDGAWDGDASPVAALEVEVADAVSGRYPVRAEVRDETGLSARAAVWVEIGAEADADADSDVDGGVDGGSDADVPDSGDVDADEGGADGGRPSFDATGGSCSCGAVGAAVENRGWVGRMRDIIGVDIRTLIVDPSI